MLCVYGGLFLLLFGRFYYIQSTGELKGHSLQQIAEKRYSAGDTIEAERGKVLDRNDNVLVEDTNSYRLIAILDENVSKNKSNPKHVVDKRKTARILAEYINWDEEKIYERLSKKGPFQVEFGPAGKSLTHDVKTAIEKEKLPGIAFITESKRHYSNGTFASHVIGFATKDEQKDGSFKTIGKMGIEKTYDKLLTGEDGRVKFKKDFFGYLLPNSEKMVTPAKDGYNIHLTIDKKIENFLEDAMSNVEQKYSPEEMVGVVANAKTGEILAMTQRPTFNPNDRLGLENNTWLNVAVEEVLEPGSTVKTFTVAAAIDSGNWYPNATYASGSYTLYDKTIRDHNTRGWGTISYYDGFLRSSNTAMANLLEVMGPDTLLTYLQKFGFGQKTGINLPNEAAGKLLSDNPIEKVTTSYGQGSTFTPIQLIQAMTAIANDGKMMQPYIIDKIVNPNTGKVVEQYSPTVKGTPIKKETAQKMKELLRATVTSEIGTGKNYNIDGYSVAGKTGTAQVPKGNGKTYYWGDHHYFYSFLGMAPVEDPQIIVYVAIKHPKMSQAIQGSVPVSEVFNPVVENTLKYLNVQPEDVAEAEIFNMDNVVGQQADDVQSALQAKGVKPIIIGEGGKIIAQYPTENVKIMKNSIVFLKTDGQPILPSFTGWSLRNVIVYKTLSQLPIEVVGEGFVENQSVSAGTTVSTNAPIVVKLKTPEEKYTEPAPQDSMEGEPAEEIVE